MPTSDYFPDPSVAHTKVEPDPVTIRSGWIDMAIRTEAPTVVDQPDSPEPRPKYDVNALAVYDPEQRDIRKQFISVKWQEGVIPVYGINGAFVEDVLEVARDRIASLNQGDFRCRENSLAITAIEEAMNWCVRRRLNRLDEGVQGTMQPHGKGA